MLNITAVLRGPARNSPQTTTNFEANRTAVLGDVLPVLCLTTRRPVAAHVSGKSSSLCASASKQANSLDARWSGMFDQDTYLPYILQVMPQVFSNVSPQLCKTSRSWCIYHILSNMYVSSHSFKIIQTYQTQHIGVDTYTSDYQQQLPFTKCVCIEEIQ